MYIQRFRNYTNQLEVQYSEYKAVVMSGQVKKSIFTHLNTSVNRVN